MSLSSLVMRAAGGYKVGDRLDGDEIVSGLESIRALWPDTLSGLRGIESVRWPDGAKCPRCGSGEVISKPDGTYGLWCCLEECCKKYRTFSIRNSTFMHNSKIAHHDWLALLFLLTATKYQITSVDLSRLIGSVSVSGCWLVRNRLMKYALSDWRFREASVSDLAIKIYLSKRRAWHRHNLDSYLKRYGK